MNTRVTSASSALLFAAIASLAGAQNQPALQNNSDLLDSVKREGDQAALVEDGGNPAELTRAESPWRLGLGIRNDFVYQSNATLQGDGGDGDFVWLPSIVGTATYKVSDEVSLESRAALQSGLYADYTELNYWGATGELLARRTLGGGWSAYAGAEAYNYQSLDSGDELTSAFAPTAGVSYGRYYAGSRTYAFADLGLKHHYTHPSIDERDEAKIAVGASKQLGDKVYAQAVFEYRYANYEEGDRNDNRNYVGLSLIYIFRENVRASAGVSFIDNDSNAAGADYRTYNIGLGSSLSWQF